MGGFARAFIPANTLIGVFSGWLVVVPVDENGSLSLKELGLRYNDITQICRHENNVICMANKDLNPDKRGWSGIDFMNHSCAPNCVVKSLIQMWSLSDIEAGTELLYDYRVIDIVPEGVECWCETDQKCLI